MATSDQPARKAAAPEPRLKWATSQQVGGVSELAVLAPIRRGIVPGERRTYEDRLRFSIANLARRHQQGIPTDLDRVSTIHFGRMIVIRPEQYLLFSKNVGIGYKADDDGGAETRGVRNPFSSSNVPKPIDDFVRIGTPPKPDEAEGRNQAEAPPNEANGGGAPPPPPELRSWLLTLVEFDGELKSYMREIVHFMGREFDRIFENCELYPRSTNFEEFWIWIRTFQITTDLFYASYRDLSVVRIRQLEAFKRRFDAFVARVRSPTGPLVRSMDELFDEFLRENQQYAAGFPTPGGTYESEDGR